MMLSNVEAKDSGTNMNISFQKLEGFSEKPIEILSWSWGVSYSNGSEVDSNSQKNSAGPIIQNISMTKYVGEKTPKMLQAVVEGQLIKKIVYKSLGESHIEMILKNAKITSLSMGGSGGESRSSEVFSIDFEEAEIKYIDKISKTMSTSLIRNTRFE